jgi:hypothetical protein
MSKIKDLTGQRFGRLTVIGLSGRLNGGAAWLCKCDCGNKKVIASKSLVTGGSQSCGCLRDEKSAMTSGNLVTLHGKSLALSVWARTYGISYSALMKRIERGATPEEAIKGLCEKAGVKYEL